MTARGISTIGIIGAGNIGSRLARLALRSGYSVVISNSRGPDTLQDLVAYLGEGATAGTVEETATAGEVVVVAIPLKDVDTVPVVPLAGKVVIDTHNYFPERDGRIAALDDASETTAGLLQRHLPQSKVVKAFNHIRAAHLISDGALAGTSPRRALAIFGDDAEARALVAAIVDEFGFDVVDGGTLAESWRSERYQPSYVHWFDRGTLEQKLDEAQRDLYS